MPTKERTKHELEHLMVSNIIPETIKALKNTMYWDDISSCAWREMVQHGKQIYPFLKIAREIAIHGTDYGEVFDVAVITIKRASYVRRTIAIHHTAGVNLFLDIDDGNGHIIDDITMITANSVSDKPPIDFRGFLRSLLTESNTINVWSMRSVKSSLHHAIRSYWKQEFRDNTSGR